MDSSTKSNRNKNNDVSESQDKVQTVLSVTASASSNLLESTGKNSPDLTVTEISQNLVNTISSTATLNSPATYPSTGPRSAVHPVIIGNVSGANLLTAAVMNKQELSPTSINLTPVQTGLVINFMPLAIRQPDNNPLTSKISASTTSLETPALRIDQDVNKCTPHELQNKSADEHSQVSLTSLESELGCRIQLSSSDTVILKTAISTSNTLPCSSLSLTSNDSVLDKVLTRRKSPVSSVEKPFNLLTNISDRSVSLESIPSLGLFQPDHGSISNVSIYKSDSVEIISDSTKDTPGTMVPDTTCSPDSSEIDVVGSNKIPHSIILLVKQHLKNMSPARDKHICLITSPEQNKRNNAGLHSASNHAINNHNISSSLSAKRQINVEDEEHSDTVMQHESVPLVNLAENSLSRSDTLVLNDNKDDSFVQSCLQLHRSDTIILTCDNNKEVQSDDKLSEGFSFTSTNSSLPLSFEALLSEPSLNKIKSVESINSSLINQSSVPFPMLAFQNDHLNKSLYVLTNDGHLAAVRYISPAPLDATQLTQLGLPNNVDAIRSVLSPSSFDTSSRNVEVKETQTDLTFGTNTVHFKLADAISGGSIYSADQLSSAVFMQSLSTQQSSIPSAVIVSVNTEPPDQPKLSLETLQGTVNLLVDPTANEKLVSESSQTVSQIIEKDFTWQQISEPELTDISSKNDRTFFKCMECQEKFKTKHDLVSHEKVHRSGFKCDLCSATFTRIGNFNRHRKIHNLQPENQNAFKCDDCGREFLQRCDLKRHLLIHTKQEPYRCERCGKGYIRRSDLVVHMRFHNKEKTFLCSVCGKKFFQTGDLSRHIRNAHMPNSQLTCGHCDRKYACESTLIRHMKAVHKDIILRTVNQTLQTRDSSDKGPSVNTKDVLFAMTKLPNRKH